jgi:hypothetical protein
MMNMIGYWEKAPSNVVVLADVSEVRATSIIRALMKKIVRTFEKSV